VIKDYELAAEKGIDIIDDFSIFLAELSAINVYNENFLFLKDLAKSFVLNGIAMEIAGTSRPYSGARQKFTHVLDYLHSTKNSLHEEQVALGTVLPGYLRGEDLGKYISCFSKEVGLPLNYREIRNPKEVIIKGINPRAKDRCERCTVLEGVGINRKIAEQACKEASII